MAKHAAYCRGLLASGQAVVFGPVADPAGVWGLGVVKAADEAAALAMTDADPVIRVRARPALRSGADDQRDCVSERSKKERLPHPFIGAGGVRSSFSFPMDCSFEMLQTTTNARSAIGSPANDFFRRRSGDRPRLALEVGEQEVDEQTDPCWNEPGILEHEMQRKRPELEFRQDTEQAAQVQPFVDHR